MLHFQVRWGDAAKEILHIAKHNKADLIIIYGHSWGASETIALARKLGHRNIPGLLTIQVDSIAKPRGRDAVIPPNVANAVNFYQTGSSMDARRLQRPILPGQRFWAISAWLTATSRSGPAVLPGSRACS